MKPIKYPGDKNPVQNITQCPDCDGSISEKDAVPFCHNCDKVVDGVKSTPYHGCVPEKGERDKAFGPRTDEITINKGTPLQQGQGTPNILFPQKANLYNQRRKAAKSQDHLKRNKKNEDFAENDEETVRDIYDSEVSMCMDPGIKNKKFDDKEDVMRSCEDLAIDG